MLLNKIAAADFNSNKDPSPPDPNALLTACLVPCLHHFSLVSPEEALKEGRSGPIQQQYWVAVREAVLKGLELVTPSKLLNSALDMKLPHPTRSLSKPEL